MRTIWALVLTTVACEAQAQRRPTGALAATSTSDSGSAIAGNPHYSANGWATRALGAVAGSGADARRNSYWAIAASAAMPGSGQAVLGERRFLPYAAFELFSWALYASHARDARARRADYRALASSVARGRFSTDRVVTCERLYFRAYIIRRIWETVTVRTMQILSASSIKIALPSCF